jgi:hypothetical protein
MEHTAKALHEVLVLVESPANLSEYGVRQFMEENLTKGRIFLVATKMDLQLERLPGADKFLWVGPAFGLKDFDLYGVTVEVKICWNHSPFVP